MRGSWQWVVYVENHEPCYFTNKDKAFQYYHNALNNITDYIKVESCKYCKILEKKVR